MDLDIHDNYNFLTKNRTVGKVWPNFLIFELMIAFIIFLVLPIYLLLLLIPIHLMAMLLCSVDYSILRNIQSIIALPKKLEP